MIQKGMRWWNDGLKNKRSIECPGDDYIQGRIPFKRRSASIETKQKLSKSLKGKSAWNKGLKDVISAETKQKMSISAKERVLRGILPDNTGNIAWNKGLTKETDCRVSKYAASQFNQVRSGNYSRGEDNGNWNANKSEYAAYSNKVRMLSEAVYRKNKSVINPNNLPRGRAGVDGAYHLDHIISVYYGFTNKIAPEEISKMENLQMLEWRENVIKSSNTEIMASCKFK